jgi:hypothetical protein
VGFAAAPKVIGTGIDAQGCETIQPISPAASCIPEGGPTKVLLPLDALCARYMMPPRGFNLLRSRFGVYGADVSSNSLIGAFSGIAILSLGISWHVTKKL